MGGHWQESQMQEHGCGLHAAVGKDGQERPQTVDTAALDASEVRRLECPLSR